MTREQLIVMAREAGFGHLATVAFWHPRFERFADLVTAAEREACAKVCEMVAFYDQMGPRDCADMIRDRGKA